MQQIISKDNLYYIYDDSSNSFLLEKASRVEVIQFYVNEIIERTESILDSKNPYGHFAISYENAVDRINNGTPRDKFC